MFCLTIFNRLDALIHKKQKHSERKSDLFYSESNLRFLREGMKQLDARNGVEHELIEPKD